MRRPKEIRGPRPVNPNESTPPRSKEPPINTRINVPVFGRFPEITILLTRLKTRSCEKRMPLFIGPSLPGRGLPTVVPDPHTLSMDALCMDAFAIGDRWLAYITRLR